MEAATTVVTTTVVTLGYDPQRQRYVGTFVGSMMTHLDAAGKVLALETEGPNCAAEGARARYRDVIEVGSDDHRVLTSHMQGDDGRWLGIMTAYRRKKQGNWAAPARQGLAVAASHRGRRRGPRPQ